MHGFVIRADSYFDGAACYAEGPYRVTVRDGRIDSVVRERDAGGAAADLSAPFLMPGLVEAHSHIFLDGGELDFERRAAYLKADFPAMIAVARANAARCAAAGVTVVRDAGDRYGVNDAIRAELAGDRNALIALRSPGLGVKRPKRYGGFMARDIVSADEIPAIVAEVAGRADDVKIILTGIIDFEAGEVKGAPQFDREELGAVVAEAHRFGRKTFAHCSGLAGLEVAVAARVDSIEHGFFMSADILKRMADKGIAWVPTFSPVDFQWRRPDLAPWNAQTVANLRRILDSHLEHVARAHVLGVELVAGSDAGSQGVEHGKALVDELFHFRQAGLPMSEILRSATSRPRRLWGMERADITAGATADIVLLAASPFENPEALRRVARVVRGGTIGPAVAGESDAQSGAAGARAR